MSTLAIPAEVAAWVTQGRTDLAVFAERGFGIKLHAAQLEAGQAVLDGRAQYYALWWANRAGKTTLLCLLHLHALFYKRGLAIPRSDREYQAWLKSGYRTLHAAPLGRLAGRAWNELSEILKGTSKAQRDPVTGDRRDAPLAGFFAVSKERVESGGDKLFLRCVNGAVCDFESTEGTGGRLEGEAWWFITWDEWPQTEGDPENVRYVLYVRLTNRAADYDAPIVLTGTITPEMEHIAKEFIALAEDPENSDWWGNSASRDLNPSTSAKSLERAERNLDAEDYQRAVLGKPGGVKGRIYPGWLLDPVFDQQLPDFTPPQRDPPEWTYLHCWDIAIAAADNAGLVFRVPIDWKFSPARPIVGVRRKVIPGSRTLIDAEIIHAIEETYLPYEGTIVIDTTDAHGKNIARTLRRAGYSVIEFDFHSREKRITKQARPSALRKDEAIDHLRKIMEDGLVKLADSKGEPLVDPDGVPLLDKDRLFGALRMPWGWSRTRDQLALLKPDDERQRKDEAMAVLMLGDVAYRKRRGQVRDERHQRLPVFASGRRLREPSARRQTRW